MIEKNMLFLTIPFLALLVGFVFTYIQVWHKKSKREAKESQVTEEIVAQLRAQKEERTNAIAESEKVSSDELKEFLEEQCLVLEKRVKDSEQANKSLSDEISKLEAKVNARQRKKPQSGYLDFGIRNVGLTKGCFGETQAAMQVLSLQTNPVTYHTTPSLQRAAKPARVKAAKTRFMSVKGASAKAKP